MLPQEKLDALNRESERLDRLGGMLSMFVIIQLALIAVILLNI